MITNEKISNLNLLYKIDLLIFGNYVDYFDWKSNKYKLNEHDRSHKLETMIKIQQMYLNRLGKL